MVSELRRRDRERETVWSQLRKGEAAWTGELATLMKRPSLFERAVGRPTGNENGGAFVAVAPSLANHAGGVALWRRRQVLIRKNCKCIHVVYFPLIPTTHIPSPVVKHTIQYLECQSHRRLDEILMKWRRAGNEMERESQRTNAP